MTDLLSQAIGSVQNSSCAFCHCWGGEPSPLMTDQHNHPHNHHIGGFLPSPLPPIGDSRKNNSTKKKPWNLLLLLLAPAAVGLRCARQSALRGAAAVAAAAMPQPARP